MEEIFYRHHWDQISGSVRLTPWRYSLKPPGGPSVFHQHSRYYILVRSTPVVTRRSLQYFRIKVFKFILDRSEYVFFFFWVYTGYPLFLFLSAALIKAAIFRLMGGGRSGSRASSSFLVPVTGTGPPKSNLYCGHSKRCSTFSCTLQWVQREVFDFLIEAKK